MKMSKSNKPGGFVFRKDEEIVEEIRQDWLKIIGDNEPAKIFMKHICTGNPAPDAIRKAGLEINKYQVRQKHAAIQEIR